jgi:hypothetical protein
MEWHDGLSTSTLTGDRRRVGELLIGGAGTADADVELHTGTAANEPREERCRSRSAVAFRPKPLGRSANTTWRADWNAHLPEKGSHETRL